MCGGDHGNQRLDQHYQRTGFQPGYSQDCDPNYETSVLGATHSTDYQASIVFLESMRDYAYVGGHSFETLKAQCVVHEIGHQVLESGAHTPSTIMSSALPVPSSQEKFGPADIATIRSKTSSPGN